MTRTADTSTPVTVRTKTANTERSGKPAKNRRTTKVAKHSSHDLPDTASLPKRWVLDSAWELIEKTNGSLKQVDTILNLHPGRKAQLQFKVLVYGFVILALQDDEMHLRKAWAALRNLPHRQQRELNIIDHRGHPLTYTQFAHKFNRAKHAIKELDKYLRGSDDDAAVAGWLVEALIFNSIPDDMPATTTMEAVDSTDIPTWGATSFEDQFGKKVTPHSASDLDATAGHRPARDGLQSGVFVGYDLHFIVDTIDGTKGIMRERPRFIRSSALAPANTPKGDVTLSALARLKARTGFTKLLADRGYSLLRPENWAHPLDKLGIKKVMDLYIKDLRKNRIRGQYQGALMIDGWPFSPSLPEHLRYLPTFDRNMTETERVELAARYDERARWGFIRSATNPDGSTRWIAPCQRGKVRCPLAPISLRAKTDRPTNTIDQIPAADNLPQCCKAVSITIPAAAFEGKLQEHAYGTTKWMNTYYQRNQVESANALLRYHRYDFRRGVIRVMGAYAHALLLAIITASINIETAREWRRRADMPEPNPDPAVEADRTYRTAVKKAKAEKAAAAAKKTYKTRKHKPKAPAPEPPGQQVPTN